MRLWLVRHGESLANQQKKVTGTQQDPLAPQGQAQSHALGLLLKTVPLAPQLLYCSPWLRARQTADLAFPDQTFTLDARLGETDAGEAADRHLPEFLRQHPDFYTQPSNHYPGGESHEALNRRVKGWLDELLTKEVTEVLAVCHSGPICCLLQQTLHIPMDRFPALLPAHASLSMIEYATTAPHAGRVKLFSQVSEAGLQQMVGARP